MDNDWGLLSILLVNEIVNTQARAFATDEVPTCGGVDLGNPKTVEEEHGDTKGQNDGRPETEFRHVSQDPSEGLG